MISKKQWLTVGIIVIIVGGIVYGVKWYKNRPQSHLFVGRLIEVKSDGNLTVEGTRVNDTNPNKSDYNHLTTVTVKITGDTKLVKTLLYLPTKAETAKTGGIFYPKDLKKEQQAGSLLDFKNHESLGLTIKTKNSTHIGDTVITAAEVDYTEPVFPK